MDAENKEFGNAAGNAAGNAGPGLRGDLNHDGAVNEADVDVLVQSFGLAEGDPEFNKEADLNGDGVVNIQDYNILRGLIRGTSA